MEFYDATKKNEKGEYKEYIRYDTEGVDEPVPETEKFSTDYGEDRIFVALKRKE